MPQNWRIQNETKSEMVDIGVMWECKQNKITIKWKRIWKNEAEKDNESLKEIIELREGNWLGELKCKKKEWTQFEGMNQRLIDWF